MNGYIIPFINFHYPYFSSESAEVDGYFNFLNSTFIPLLNTLERLENDDIEYSLSLSLSTSLINLLANPDLTNRYCRRTRNLQAEETRNERRDALRDNLFLMSQYNYRPLDGLRRLAAYGHLEIITGGAATNAPLSLLAPVPEAVKAQISIALAVYQHYFEHECHGINLYPNWCYQQLPELLNELKVEYLIISPAPSLRTLKTNRPMVAGSNIGVLAADVSLSDIFTESLAGDWQKADDNANNYIEILRNNISREVKESNGKPPVYLIFADASQLQKENRSRKLNTVFLELLLRKISCDQKDIGLEKPASYLSSNDVFVDSDAIGMFTPNLTPYYQSGYQQLFPDLHIAALKLGKLNRNKESAAIRAKMVRELILAQSGDHRPHEDTFCREHLQKFTALINSFDDTLQSHADSTSADVGSDDFLTDIDLSNFY